jgi:hypothetical protein
VHRLGNGAVEVAERSLRLRQRNPLPASNKVGNEGGGAVDSESLALLTSTLSRNRHLNRSIVRRQHSPQVRRTSVADSSTLSKRQNRSHAPAFEGELGVPHRVNTAMQAVQPSCLDPDTPGIRA